MKTKTYLIDMTEEERLQRRRESARKWYNKHKDDPELKAKSKTKTYKYREEHTEEFKEYCKQYYKKHHVPKYTEEELKAKRELQLQKGRERAKRYNEEHKEERKRKYEEKKKNSVPVVYGYTDEDDDIVYIGSSMCLENRIHARLCSSKVEFDILYRQNPDKFELFIFQKCKSIEEARDIEKKLIWKIQPKYNKQYNNC